MGFEIEFTIDAIDDTKEVEAQLEYQPTEEALNRKKLRPNQLAEWELRINRFRVFYDVDTERKRVKIEAVGYKRGNQLFIQGEVYEL